MYASNRSIVKNDHKRKNLNFKDPELLFEEDRQAYDTWQICRGHYIEFLVLQIYTKKMYNIILNDF